MNATRKLPPNAAREGARLLDWPCTMLLSDQFWPSADEHTSKALPPLLAMNDTQSRLLKTARDGKSLLDCTAFPGPPASLGIGFGAFARQNEAPFVLMSSVLL